ncbi:hypothetical protein [Deinococcus sp. 23YEL01]|uniref:hypothetical protein n=1 Tax=Deinococcus sp. 23YEL01 TaxID=2745871 RepID=UPI001E47FA62|nr:hypothetical protein [Deinococcus sp. 23YEL01]MCD0171584.1 hypothetical protein [Deinococcus sp. 23YEL01]
MGVPARLLLSFLIAACALLGLYMSAYAFGVPRRALLAAQVGGLTGAAALIAAVWRLTGRWLWLALPVVAGLALLLLWQGGGL